MSRALRVLAILVVAAVALEGRALASTYPLGHILPEDAAKKLAKAGVNSSDELLEQGATPAGRTKLAKASGLPAKQLLEWVRMSDLLRIKGVGPVMVKLLAAADVVSVAQLKQRVAKKLYDKVMAANEKATDHQEPAEREAPRELDRAGEET